MGADNLREMLEEIGRRARSAVRTLASAADPRTSLPRRLERLSDAQHRICTSFPRFSDEIEFWEQMWRCTDAVRDQWRKVARAAAHRSAELEQHVHRTSVPACRELYRWSRKFITDNAPRVPEKHLFSFGLERISPDLRELHERIEGLYESIKRQGQFPPLKLDMALEEGGVNFGIIYGGGWNVSAYSILSAAEEVEGLKAFIAFDHRGESIFASTGSHTVRLAPCALVMDHEGEFVLAGFRKPPTLHFACPHQWTGPPPHDLGIPVLRSEITVRVTTGKELTSGALREYERSTGYRFNMIAEEFIGRPDFPADIDSVIVSAAKAVERLAGRGIREIVVKPSRGEQGRGVKEFVIPSRKEEAVRHAVNLAIDTGTLLQERVVPEGEPDYNWRVFVAASPRGEPEIAGRFARIGRGDDIEMVEETDMLRRAGISDREGKELMSRMDERSLHAFRAVVRHSKKLMPPDFPPAPLGETGSYAMPYFLGIDLIGDARIMEVNGSEVAGMWTHDRLYPHQRGRSSLTMLRSARQAALAYKRAIG